MWWICRVPGTPERGALPFDADIVGCRPVRAKRAMTQARQHRPEPDLPLFAMETEALISWSGVCFPGCRLTPRVALLHHPFQSPSPDLYEATAPAGRRQAGMTPCTRGGPRPPQPRPNTT